MGNIYWNPGSYQGFHRTRRLARKQRKAGLNLGFVGLGNSAPKYQNKKHFRSRRTYKVGGLPLWSRAAL